MYWSGSAHARALQRSPRPAGDRVKTDAKDAIHLARLLRLDEITPSCPRSTRKRHATWSGDYITSRSSAPTSSAPCAGGLHHIAISVEAAKWERLKQNLESAWS